MLQTIKFLKEETPMNIYSRRAWWSREHAIAKKIQREDKVKTVYCLHHYIHPGMSTVINIGPLPISESKQQTETIQLRRIISN